MSEFVAVIISSIVLMAITMIYDKTGKKEKKDKNE